MNQPKLRANTCSHAIYTSLVSSKKWSDEHTRRRARLLEKIHAGGGLLHSGKRIEMCSRRVVRCGRVAELGPPLVLSQ